MNTSATNNQILQTEPVNVDPKLLLEREKFEFEKLRVSREAKSFTKRVALAVTIVTLIGGVIGVVVTIKKNSDDITKAKEEKIRIAEDRRLTVAKFLLEQNAKIYSGDTNEREYAIAVLSIVISDEKLKNLTLAKLAQGTSNEKAKLDFRNAQTRVVINSEDLQETDINKASSEKSVEFDRVKNSPSNKINPIPEDSKNRTPEDISFVVTANEKISGSYIFKISIKASEKTLAEIEKVEYKIAHPSFKKKDYIGKDRVSNFAMTYEGWGAVDEIQAAVRFKSGKSLTSNIDMIKELNW